MNEMFPEVSNCFSYLVEIGNKLAVGILPWWRLSHGWCLMSHADVLMSGSQMSASLDQDDVTCSWHCETSVASHQASSPQLQWSQASAQISTSSRMRPARPPIGRGPLSETYDWLSQTIASPVRHTATPGLLYTITSFC